MRIGELAERAGVASHTIRYYEEQGVLPAPARTASGYREYDPAALEDLAFIRKAQVLGLRLQQIAEVMEIASGGRPPCEHVRTLLAHRLQEVQGRLTELRDLERTLREALRRLDAGGRRAEGCRCDVIEEVDP